MESVDITKYHYEVTDLPFILDPEEVSSPEEQFSLMGYVTTPTIGRYGGGGYTLDNPLFVLVLPCQIRQGTCYYRQQKLNLPPQVIQNLTNIDQLIIHNRPPKKFQQSQSQEDEQQNKHAPEYNPETFTSRPYFTLRFIISMSQIKKPQQFMNYVCHNYIFKHDNFQHTKRHVALIPICLVPCANSGIYEWKKDHKSIKWNELRSEYMSFHMKKGAPAFSPNNMKIGLENKEKVLNFYTVILTQLQYCVNYHWHLLEDFETPIVDVLKSSKSIQQLITFYRNFKGDDGAVSELERIFKK